MRKTYLLAITGLLSLSFLFTACSPSNTDSSSPDSSDSTSPSEEWISSDWTEIPDNTNENLKYFGYYHSDGFGALQSSYVDEIGELGNANVAMVNSAFDTTEALKDLEEVKENGMEAILSVHGFTNGGQTGKIGSAHLKEDYKELWTEYQATLQPYIDDGTIYAFYFDEPRWNGINCEDFRTLTKHIREQVPSVGVMACMTAMDIGIGNYGGVGECEDNYLEYCTDVTFDSYDDWDDAQRREYLQKMKDKAANDAWIWGCPKGFENEPEISGIEKMVDHIKGQYTEAIQDERYRGIVSFTYANGTVEGDWGFGLCDFFDDQNDYYSKELKDLYIEIGCAVIGKEPPEIVDVNFTIKEATRTYAPESEISVPEASAADEKGNSYEVTYEVTDPAGEKIETTDGKFTASASGWYTVTYKSEIEGKTYTKGTEIYVRQPLEISTFETKIFAADAVGDSADVWCWPREVTEVFKRTGRGSLIVKPHPTDGTWPNIYFAVEGSNEHDMMKYGGISAWLYNPSDEAITTFGIKVNNGNQTNEKTKVITLPSKQWTEFSMTKEEMLEGNANLDLTKVRIAITNTGSSYTNRTEFYVDDVFFTAGEETPPETESFAVDFEQAGDLSLLLLNVDSDWAWPDRSVSTEQAHSGNSSLKVVPRSDGGKWPIMVIKIGGNDTFDMTDYEEISLWIYNPSDTVIKNFGISVEDSGGKKKDAVKDIPSKEWTELKLTKEEIVAAGADITALKLSFSNMDSDYTNKTAFYIDDIKLA